MRSKLVVLALASVVVLAACEQILGIDKYEKCDGPCDAGLLETGAVDGGDAATDAFQLPDGVSEASSWPRWIMPNTTVEVQNGASDASLPDVATTDAGVLDKHTGLAWLTPIGTAATIEAASAYCASLSARLPTRIELVTLLDSTRQVPPYIIPSLDSAVIAAKVDKAYLWTSSYVRPIGNQLEFWFASLASGDMLQSTPGTAGVLCVR